ncbi:hypothetical protein [Legionella norrlandica]|uniref:hypothetical protein n=1 Tax=Legionella norrlandica TaxID=1498499 RepID=UPI0006912FA9|nr:hypothetical protein [Legionella norrlandica]
MFHVDNSGKGNCLYYAYSISLMYYLRAKNNIRITEDIFNKLKLKEKDRISLRKLLSKEAGEAFSSKEIKTIIEPILGRATRDLAAEHTKAEFKASPQDTPLFSSLQYGLEFGFKRSMEENGSELSMLIDHDFSNHDYIEAEIYKVRDIFHAMETFIISRTSHVIEEFNRQWTNKKQELKELELSEKDIQSHQAAILDNLMRQETVEFFLSDNENYLNQYRDHLQSEYVWGSEETLMVLHRAIQGERMERNLKGTIDTSYDNEIVLHLHRNGIAPFQQAGSPAMILNNEGNAHWTSIIPESIFIPKFADKEQNLIEIIEKIQEEHGNKPLGAEKYSFVSDWTSDLRKQIDVIKACPNTAMTEKAIEYFFQLMGKAVPKLVSESSLMSSFSNIFSAFLECIPALMSEKKVSIGLAQLGLYSHDRGSKIAKNEVLLPESLSKEETVDETVSVSLL